MSSELQTKCIHKPVEKKDGLRISVMSRHTLNDGLTVDKSIIPGTTFSLWIIQLAPPEKLVGDWYKRGLDWKVFEDRYLDFLKNPIQRLRTQELIELSLKEKVTILCVEETPEFCHRRLLAEECKKLEPNLMLILK